MAGREEKAKREETPHEGQEFLFKRRSFGYPKVSLSPFRRQGQEKSKRIKKVISLRTPV